MKKLVVALVGLAAIFIAVASGCAADKPQTPPGKAGDQAKPAASAIVSAPAKAENGKQPGITKKTDAETRTVAATVIAENRPKAKHDAELQYRDEDILGTRTGPDGKVEKVIRPGAKPIQAGNAAKHPDVAKKVHETPAAGAQPAKPSAPVTAASKAGPDKSSTAADVKKDTVSKKPEDKSLAKKAPETGTAAVAGTSARSKSSLAGKKRGKKAAHRKRHRKHYATRSHRRHRHARHHVRHRYAHKRAGTHKYAKRHKHKHVKAHKAKHGVKNAQAKPAAAPQVATKLKTEAKPADTKQGNKAVAAPNGTK